ncbi:MAG: hypothetical protein QM719_03405 [Thermomonas sp.]
MKTHRIAFAAAILALAACATPEPPSTTDAPAGKRPAGQENAPPIAWRAVGTEPFWGVRVDGDALVFTTPDDPDGQRLPATSESQGDAMVWSGSADGRDYSLRIAPGECSDGMSDNAFDHTADFRIGATEYKGCAEAAK